MTKDKAGLRSNPNAAWETDKAIIASLPWRWAPATAKSDKMDWEQAGILSCDLSLLPEGQTPESIVVILRQYDDSLNLTLLKSEDAPIVNISLNKLGDFVSLYGDHCLNQKSKPRAAAEKLRLADFSFSLSQKGEDIYVFCQTREEGEAARRLLHDNKINTKSLTLAEGQWRLAISVNQRGVLEQLGLEIQPYSAKAVRERKRSEGGAIAL